jgi:hypothetical protein
MAAKNEHQLPENTWNPSFKSSSPPYKKIKGQVMVVKERL